MSCRAKRSEVETSPPLPIPAASVGKWIRRGYGVRRRCLHVGGKPPPVDMTRGERLGCSCRRETAVGVDGFPGRVFHVLTDAATENEAACHVERSEVETSPPLPTPTASVGAWRRRCLGAWRRCLHVGAKPPPVDMTRGARLGCSCRREAVVGVAGLRAAFSTS